MAKRSGQQLRRTAAQMHALAAVRHDIGSQDSARGRGYLREFTQQFREYDGVLSPSELQQKIAAASTVLIGDYHALPACQRFAAELIETSARKRRVVLGVEAVLARDQRILDAWWRREIPEDELRRRLRFDREWGYQWDPFYQLLCTARDHAEGVYALDCMPREDLRRIRSRDRHAAAKIVEIRDRHPDAGIFVLFGESHMAPQHLPLAVRELMPKQKLLTVLQNVDALYWKAVAQQAPAVSMGEDAVCVFNSSPLEKYESYRLCLSRWNAALDDLPDFAPAIYNLIFSLARSLGFRLDSPRNGTQPKYLADSLPEVVTFDQYPASEAARFEERSCVYVPDANLFVIREFQMADAAEECARFLHSVCRGMTKLSEQAQPVEDALARFSSRLLCPEFDLADQSATLGDSLYQSYLAGKISPLALRRLFLARLESREQVRRTSGAIEYLTRA
jgi:Haem-binding uptake, Tiki superfamily, ChaN